ncbi:hypothetical protein, partial [Klebsiella pneumoniae]|uniref:hypothetical protein n=1 Tax=Klebsiella pneumoniae TaxID=573 RepID=UPI003EE0A4B3
DASCCANNQWICCVNHFVNVLLVTAVFQRLSQATKSRQSTPVFVREKLVIKHNGNAEQDLGMRRILLGAPR